MSVEERTLLLHSVERVAKSIVAVLSSSDDPKTVSAWATLVGKSEKALRTHCRAARLRPKDALDFARLLRACILLQQRMDSNIQDVLDVVDPRTMSSLSRRSHIEKIEVRLCHIPAKHFVFQQTLVSDEDMKLAVLHHLEEEDGRLLPWQRG